MVIGDGPDIEQFDRKSEDEQKLYEKVDKWWHSLNDTYKFELLEPTYPDRLHLMGMDEAWNKLEWQDKLDIYNEAEGFEVRI